MLGFSLAKLFLKWAPEYLAFRIHLAQASEGIVQCLLGYRYPWRAFLRFSVGIYCSFNVRFNLWKLWLILLGKRVRRSELLFLVLVFLDGTLRVSQHGRGDLFSELILKAVSFVLFCRLGAM